MGFAGVLEVFSCPWFVQSIGFGRLQRISLALARPYTPKAPTKFFPGLSGEFRMELVQGESPKKSKTSEAPMSRHPEKHVNVRILPLGSVKAPRERLQSVC